MRLKTISSSINRRLDSFWDISTIEYYAVILFKGGHYRYGTIIMTYCYMKTRKLQNSMYRKMMPFLKVLLLLKILIIHSKNWKIWQQNIHRDSLEGKATRKLASATLAWVCVMAEESQRHSPHPREGKPLGSDTNPQSYPHKPFDNHLPPSPPL